MCNLLKVLGRCQGGAEAYLHSLTHLWTVHLCGESCLAYGLFNYSGLSLNKAHLRFCVLVARILVAEVDVQVNFITSVYLGEVLRVV